MLTEAPGRRVSGVRKGSPRQLRRYLIRGGAAGFVAILPGTHVVSRMNFPKEARELTLPRAIAAELTTAVDAEGFPRAAAWANAPSILFSADWRGKNADSTRETQVQLLWTRENLYLRFQCRYREITVFPDAEPNGRRDQLWDRDVAEVFLQPEPARALHYLEFEVSPNGQWIDLAIDRTTVPHQKRDLKSGLKRRTHLDTRMKLWTAELAIPMKSLAAHFDPSQRWRVNFYRVEGKEEPRFYSAWSPTNTPRPNFHVPESYGELMFRDAARATEAAAQRGAYRES